MYLQNESITSIYIILLFLYLKINYTKDHDSYMLHVNVWFLWHIQLAFDIKYFTGVSIFPALLNSIKSRKLDVFFETEEKIMGRATLEKPLLEVSLY